ncbi:MAG: DNA polymerase III subunit gamma/tau [Hyphomicrobium sp.]
MAKKKLTGEVETNGGVQAAAKPYVVLARKYRPATFDDLIGQEAMVQTLRNAFATGRIAQGYMLTGVRGVGKTTTARILARALNYSTDTIDQPTIDMPVFGRHCADIIESRHPDVIEMDAASNTGIDNIREIIESARYKPILARIKVFIIDEVHMLSKAAFNGLLKTLEEPPEHVKFIFATTEIRKVPVTVLSRCQRFDLRRVGVPVLVRHFEKITANEGATVESDALAMIARAAEGSVRDGLSILDQAIAMGSGGAGTGTVPAATVRAMLGLADRGRIFDLLEILFSGTPAAALNTFAGLYHDGADPTQVLGELAETVHLVTRIKAAGPEAGGEALPSEDKRRAAALAAQLSVPLLARAWQMLLKGLEETAKAPDPVAAAEMVLIRIAYTADLPSPGDIIKAMGGDSVAVVRRGEASPAAAGPVPRTTINQAASPAQIANRAPALVKAPVPAVPPGVRPPWEEQDAPPLAVQAPSASAPDFASDEEAFNQLASGIGHDEFTEPVIEGLEVEEDGIARPPATASLRPIRTFADVVALVGDRRDVRLKIQLEEQVSLVKFDAASGAIDLFLLPGAGGEIANELREKLNAWTGRRWMVMLSKVRGGPALGEIRREREAQDLAAVKAHPAVAAILAEFPDAKIAGIRVIDQDRDGETGTG